MINRIKKVISNKKALKTFLAEIIIFLNKYFYLPKKLSRIAMHLEGTRCFRKSKLTWNEKGFWFLNPMPSEAELNNYYKNTYWDNFHDGKNININRRSIDHFVLIKKYIDFENLSSKRFLNFGAGEGGVSFLFKLHGWEVTNVEPSKMVNFNWNQVSSLEEAYGEYDLIYSSHSLEHVNDITKYVKLFSDKLRKGGVIFFEVPNCEKSVEIISPHTYYFTKNFFNTLNFNIQLLETFHYKSGISSEIVKNNNGDVIRFIGSK